MRRFKTNALIVAAVFLMCACDPMESNWREASDKNTTAAFESFIAEHPNSKYENEARQKIEGLEWEKTSSDNDLDGLRAYVAKYPKSSFRGLAMERIADLEVLKAAEDQIRLFSSFDDDLIGYFNKTETSIASIQNRARDDQHLTFGILSGGFTRLGGRATAHPGSVIVVEDADKQFQVSGVVGSDGTSLRTIKSMEFKPGVRLRFVSGETYEYREGDWKRITVDPQ